MVLPVNPTAGRPVNIIVCYGSAIPFKSYAVVVTDSNTSCCTLSA
jgi:hypothetical protein